MDELDRALRGVLTDERLDLPLVPGAVQMVHEGVRRRRRRRAVVATAASAAAVVAVTGAALLLTGPGNDAVDQPIGPLRTATPTPAATPNATKPPAPPASASVVTWNDTAYDYTRPPAFPGATPDPSVPWCTAAQLGLSVDLQGATGNLVGGADVTNTSSTTCAVQGQPAVQVRAASGRVLVATQPDVFYVTAWVKLVPGASARAGIEWLQEYCNEPAPTAITLDLPHGGGALSTKSTGSPRCNVATDPPSAGSLHVSGFVARGPNADTEVFTPEAALQASIDRWQRTVISGGLLTYRLRLQDLQNAPLSLDPCLPFRERLVDRTGHVAVEELHVLNCAGVADAVSDPADVRDISFDMQLRAPTALAPGDYSLVWQSVLEPVNANAPDVVHVTAAPPPCAEGQLTLTRGASGAATGHYSDVVVLTNNTPTACSLRGYPGVQWVADDGSRLPTTPRHGGSFTFPDLPLTTVVLQAHGGAASFAVGGADFVPPAGATACAKTQGLLVIPPGLRQQVLVKGVGADCENGAIDVSVVVAGKAGPRF